MAKKAKKKVDETEQTEETTTTEAPTVRAQLEEAFAAQAKADDETKEDETKTDDTTTTEDEETTTDETTTEETTTDDDEVTTEETDETVTQETASTEEETEETDETTEPTEIVIPKHFSPEDREAFEGLDEKQQRWMLGRYKAMETHYTQRMQDLSEFRKTYTEVEQALAPHQQTMLIHGLTPGQLVARWGNAELNLQQNPVEAIKWLAESYGVSLGALSGSEDTVDEFADPEIQALRKEVADLRSEQKAGKDAVQQQQATASQLAIAEFIDAKDDKGNLKHPHAKNDAVLTKMTQLAYADRSVGKTPDLNDLYSTAIMLVPEVREQVTAAQTRQQTSAQQKAAAKKAARAKKAGSSVTTAPTTKEKPSLEDLPLREQLRRQLDPNALH